MRSGDTNQKNGAPWRSRRAVVRGAALLALVGTAGGLAGCGLFDGEPDPPPTPDPLGPLIIGALDLAARYEAAVMAVPELAERLRPIAVAHRMHAAELARVTRTALPSPTATVAPTPAADRAGVLRSLREAEQAGRDAARQACAEAPAERAALLGSIAAARATHLEMLR